jgi:hypothetical protein
MILDLLTKLAFDIDMIIELLICQIDIITIIYILYISYVHENGNLHLFSAKVTIIWIHFFLTSNTLKLLNEIKNKLKSHVANS